MMRVKRILSSISRFVDRHLRRLSVRYGRWTLFIAGLSVVGVVLAFAALRSPETLGPRVTREDLSTLDGLADVLLSVVGISLLIGVITSGLVEIFKNVTSIRGWFHRNEIAKYLGEGLRHRYGVEREEDSHDQLERALGRSTLSGYYSEEVGRKGDEAKYFGARPSRDLRYIYDLPLEQLAAQLSAAAELAIAEELHLPGSYSDFLNALEGDMSPAADDEGGPARTDDERYREQARRAQRIQRAIDVLQIVIGHRWRWFIRTMAIFIAAPVALLAAEYSATSGSARVFAVLFATLLGGFFAWLVRDVTAAIQRLRR